MVCPHCNGSGSVTTWRPSQVYEYGFNGNPENGSWSTRRCARCEGGGHVSDEACGFFGWLLVLAAGAAVVGWIVRS